MAIATHMRSHHMDSIPIDTCIIGSFKLNSIDLSSLTSCGLMVTFHRFPLTLFDRIVSRRNESKINLSYLLYGTQNRKFDLSYPKSNANEGNPLETTDFPLGFNVLTPFPSLAFLFPSLTLTQTCAYTSSAYNDAREPCHTRTAAIGWEIGTSSTWGVYFFDQDTCTMRLVDP